MEGRAYNDDPVRSRVMKYSDVYSPSMDRLFYVSVDDGSRKGILLGPYGSHQEACDNVDRGSALAEAADPRAAFYAFGTCSTPRAHPLRPVFTKEGGIPNGD